MKNSTYQPVTPIVEGERRAAPRRQVERRTEMPESARVFLGWLVPQERRIDVRRHVTRRRCDRGIV
ncbi:MAG TPA: hypothetical protein VMF61_02275 [Candidatus Acidoferrales bacterium]|nr:hypothetical protein [Candidatus Acidoferrales bacterium]